MVLAGYISNSLCVVVEKYGGSLYVVVKGYTYIYTPRSIICGTAVGAELVACDLMFILAFKLY